MKKLFISILCAFTAFAAVSCVEEVLNFEYPEIGVEKTVQFSTEPMTKTVFGEKSGTTIPTLWTDTYCVALSLNYANAKKSTTPEVGTGSTTARFSAEIADDNSGAYTFFAVSPYDQFVSINSTYTSVQIEVPTAQTTLDASPDEKAQILFGQYNAGSTFPTSVTLPFRHLTAYGKISFKNLSLAGGESIASVSLTAAENWAGRFYYYVEANGSNAAGDYVANPGAKTITIATNRTNDIWFGCAPVDLGGKTVDVVITTNNGTTYSKTIHIPAGKKFEAGKVSAFTIDMDGINADGAVVYNLVTDVADLTLGSEVIIVANTFNYAMSTTQNGNNRGQASITKSGSVINSPGADVQVFTIANGTKGGTYAFSTGSGFIYAASSGSNYLRTEETLSANSSWGISITAAGVATVTAVGNNTRNVLQYNDGSSIFSCYGSASQKAISIYKKSGTGSGAINPKVAESIAISGATTSYDVNDTFSFDGTVTLTYSDKSTAVLSASDYTVDDSDVDMTTADTYTVTITYNDDTSITDSYDITVNGSGGGSGGNNPVTVIFVAGTDTSSSTTLTKDNVSLTVTSGTFSRTDNYRIYANNSLTVTAPTGKLITSIVFTISQNTFTTTNGSYDATNQTWTGSSNSVTLAASGGQVRATRIEVTYE